MLAKSCGTGQSPDLGTQVVARYAPDHPIGNSYFVGHQGLLRIDIGPVTPATSATIIDPEVEVDLSATGPSGIGFAPPSSEFPNLDYERFDAASGGFVAFDGSSGGITQRVRLRNAGTFANFANGATFMFGLVSFDPAVATPGHFAGLTFDVSMHIRATQFSANLESCNWSASSLAHGQVLKP